MARIYRTLIIRDGFNYLTGRARYRVIDCWDIDTVTFSRVWKLKTWLAIVTDRKYQKGCFVNPRTALFG